MALETITLTFATTGGAGASASPAIDGSIAFAGNVSTRPLNGRLIKVYVDYGTSNASTTDIVIKTLGKVSPSETILTLTNANTNGWFYPRVPTVTNAGAAATYDGTVAALDAAAVDDYVAVTVAQGNDKTLNIYLVLER